MEAKKRGRPPGIPNPNGGRPRNVEKTWLIKVYASSELKDRVTEESRREKISESGFVARVLQSYFQGVKFF